jgi:hypothetical protein
MSEREELAVILETEQEHGNWPSTPDADLYGCMADAILAAGYSKPRTITTAEEIRELPALTMVVYDDMANGGPLEAYVVPEDGTVMFKVGYPFNMLCMNGEYVNAEDMPLPLTVTYEVNP